MSSRKAKQIKSKINNMKKKKKNVNSFYKSLSGCWLPWDFACQPSQVKPSQRWLNLLLTIASTSCWFFLYFSTSSSVSALSNQPFRNRAIIPMKHQHLISIPSVTSLLQPDTAQLLFNAQTQTHIDTKRSFAVVSMHLYLSGLLAGLYQPAAYLSVHFVYTVYTIPLPIFRGQFLFYSPELKRSFE